MTSVDLGRRSIRIALAIVLGAMADKGSFLAPPAAGALRDADRAHRLAQKNWSRDTNASTCHSIATISSACALRRIDH